MKQRGLALIEVLIVAAVLAVLAAIAVPNFQEAQIRTKLSRVKADQRDLAVAIEAYKVDWGIYPPDQPGMIWSTWPSFGWAYAGYHQKLGLLTSPEAYIVTVPKDPFGGVYNHMYGGASLTPDGDGPSDWYFYENYWHGFEYWVNGPTPPIISVGDLYGRISAGWQLNSDGPAQVWFYPLGEFGFVLEDGSMSGDARAVQYDPTNGSRSMGVLSRWGSSDIAIPQMRQTRAAQ